MLCPYAFAMIIALSLPAITFGYLIAIKRRFDLLPGVNKTNFARPEAYAKSIGRGLLIIGVCSTVTGIFWCVSELSLMKVAVSSLILVIISLICFFMVYLNASKPSSPAEKHEEDT